jgi:transposase
MDTQPFIGQQERIDDVPLLIGMMGRMKLAEVLDKHLGRHHLHLGLSNGQLAVGWIAYILSQSDHRKYAVQDWAEGLSHTLESLFGCSLRPHEFSDDRLGILLDRLAQVDWAAVEADLFHSCFAIYELPSGCVRLDTTTSCGYHAIDPDGIMQLGHSKDHRPDLPQLKLMAAVTQPLAFPLATDIVPGNTADDVLYWPTIVKVKELIKKVGLLFVGDNKMAALETRGRIARAKDYYLMPLPHTGHTAKLFDSWVDEALRKEKHPQPAEDGQKSDQLTEVWQTNEEDEKTLIAKGYEFTRTLTATIDQKAETWTERVQVLQSQSLLSSQQTSLGKKLRQAEEDVRKLTRTGKGHKVWREENELAQAVKDILHDKDVEGLLAVQWAKEQSTTKRYGTGGRPKAGAVAKEEVQIRYQISAVKRVEETIKERQERLGWRAEVTNAPEERLSFEASVLTYRAGAGLERPFHQMKDEPLGIRPLFVKKEEQIKGLTRLVMIALRVLTLIEIVARAKLAEAGEKLVGMHEGQKNKKEGKPTARRLLRGIARLQLTLSEVVYQGVASWHLPVLPSLLVRVLALLGLSPTLYTDLTRSGPVPLSPASLAGVPWG